MNSAYIILGGNIGDTLKILDQASKILEEIGTITRHSSFYKTKAWGKKDQPDFINQVIRLETALHAQELMDYCLKTEKELGRVRFEKWDARTIDIDILYFNEDIFSSSKLTIPHPEIENRRFVLVPLCEISPDYAHPLIGATNKELLKNTKDKLAVERLDDGFNIMANY